MPKEAPTTHFICRAMNSEELCVGDYLSLPVPGNCPLTPGLVGAPALELVTCCHVREIKESICCSFGGQPSPNHGTCSPLNCLLT